MTANIMMIEADWRKAWKPFFKYSFWGTIVLSGYEMGACNYESDNLSSPIR